MVKQFTPRKLDILERIQSHSSVTSHTLADEMGIPLSYASRYLRYYHNQGLLKRKPIVMEQGGIRFRYILSNLGSKKILFFKSKK